MAQILALVTSNKPRTFPVPAPQTLPHSFSPSASPSYSPPGLSLAILFLWGFACSSLLLLAVGQLGSLSVYPNRWAVSPVPAGNGSDDGQLWKAEGGVGMSASLWASVKEGGFSLSFGMKGSSSCGGSSNSHSSSSSSNRSISNNSSSSSLSMSSDSSVGSEGGSSANDRKQSHSSWVISRSSAPDELQTSSNSVINSAKSLQQGTAHGAWVSPQFASPGSSSQAAGSQGALSSEGERIGLFPGLPGSDPVPEKEAGRIAFLFLTSGPLPLAALWERFFKGHEGEYSVYIHCSREDQSTCLEDLGTSGPGKSVFQGRLIPGGPVFWGEMSMVDAERKLLAHAYLDPRNSHFALLSESCIPLWPFDHVKEYLFSARVSFVDVYEDDAGEGFGRWNWEAFGTMIQREEYVKGQQWLVLLRMHVEMVLSDMHHYAMHGRNCKQCCPDEHYIQNLLHQLAPQNISSYSTTFTFWIGSEIHPKLYDPEHLSRGVIGAMKKVNNFVRYRQDYERKKNSKAAYKLFYTHAKDPVKGLNGTTPTAEKGFCAVDGMLRHCFLFARKFPGSSLQWLLQHSQETLGY